MCERASTFMYNNQLGATVATVANDSDGFNFFVIVNYRANRLMNWLNKYIDLKNNYTQDGGYWFDTDLKRRISGAGVILIENYGHGAVKRPCIIVFRSLLRGDRFGKYEITAGEIGSPPEIPVPPPPWVTASKELREESRGMFHVDQNIIHGLLPEDVNFEQGGVTKYNRIYMMLVSSAHGLVSHHYHRNIGIINANIARMRPHHAGQYMETDEIARIPIASLQAALGPPSAVGDFNINGFLPHGANAMITLNGKQRNILRQCLTKINGLIVGAPVYPLLNFDPNDMHGRTIGTPYEGTATYWL